jgi:predicted ATP-grasp superfamily ATP-dependent carboligase
MRHDAGPRAVILGANHPSALAAVRSLGRAGIPVVAVDHDPGAKVFGSRYLAGRHVVRGDEASVLASLEELGRDGGGLLIPTSDEYLALVSRNFERLSRLFVSTVPPWDVMQPLMHKPRSYELAREIGLDIPRFYVPEDADALERILASLDFHRHRYLLSRVDGADPGIVDPKTGRAIIGAGADAGAAREACLDILRRTGTLPMIVEIVPGEANTATGVVMVVDRRHEAVVCYCLRRMQLYPHAKLAAFVHPYTLGWNVYCETVHDDEAVEAAKRLVRHARFYGTVIVEFRRDATNGRLTFIKFDPRIERAAAISSVLGMDVSLALYKVFTEQPLDVPGDYPDGVAWIWITWYLNRLWENRSRSPFGRELLALVGKLPKVRADAYLSARDPMPFLTDCLGWARRWAGAARRRAARLRGA